MRLQLPCVIAHLLVALTGCSDDSPAHSWGVDSGMDSGSPGEQSDARTVVMDGGTVSSGDARSSDAWWTLADASDDFDGGSMTQVPDAAPGPAAACAVPLPSGSVLFGPDHRGIVVLSATATRVLSVDDGTYTASAKLWQLWDATSGARIASGDGVFDGTISGDIFVLERGSELSVRRSIDGTEMSKIAFTVTRQPTAGLPGPTTGLPGGERWGIASDAGYVWTADSNSFRVFAPSGALQLTLPGSYLAVQASAQTKHIDVFRGPAGANAIQHIELATGSATTTTFTGEFYSWSGTGDRFFALSGSSGVRVYNADGTQLALIAWPSNITTSLYGYGDYVWSGSDTIPIRLFKVEAGSATEIPWPSATFNMSAQAPTAHFLSVSREGINGAATTAGVFDLSTNPPTFIREWPYTPTFAASTSDLYVASSGLVRSYSLTGGPDTSFNCGAVLGAALSQSGRFAVSMAAGQIVIGSLTDRTKVNTIGFAYNHQGVYGAGMGFSSDGQRLLVHDVGNASLFDASDGSLVSQLQVPSIGGSTTNLRTAALSSDGRKAFLASCLQNVCTETVTDIASNAVSFNLQQPFSAIAVSPSTELLALDSGTDGSPSNASTSIYRDGVLTGFATGLPVAWLVL